MQTANSQNGDVEKKAAKMQEAIRLTVMMAAAIAIFQTKGVLSRLLHSRSAAYVVTTVAVFALMPVTRKIWPPEGERPLTARTWVIWAVFLGALALGLTLIDAPPAFLSAWFKAHPVFAALESAGGGWLLPGAMLLICGLIYLFRGKGRHDQTGGR